MNHFSGHLAARFLVAGLAVLAASSIMSCDVFNYSDPIDQRLYSENLISKIGFDVNVTADTQPDAADPTTGSWDFAYRYADWSDHFAYMTLDAVTTAGYTTAGDVASSLSETIPSGLSSTAGVYRLEIKNLVTGGDFESGLTGTWTPSSATKASAVHDSGAAERTVNGSYSVRLDASTGESIVYVPTTISGYQFNKSLPYYFLFRYTNGGTDLPYVADNDTTDYYSSKPGDYDSYNYLKGDYTPKASGDAPYLKFSPQASSSISAFDVDDVMLTRTGEMLLRLRLCPDETSVPMIEGRYTFSVWVHADPETTSSAVPYPMDSFSITMENASNGKNAASSTTTYVQGTSGWQQLTVTHSSSALQFIVKSTTALPVIDLVLNCNVSLPGRILLAAPEFRMTQ